MAESSPPARLTSARGAHEADGHGELYTDFDATVQPQPAAVTQSSGQNGGYEVRLERETVVVVGKGGPDLRFKTYMMVRKR